MVCLCKLELNLRVLHIFIYLHSWLENLLCECWPEDQALRCHVDSCSTITLNFRSEPTPEMWKLTLVLWFYRGIRDGQSSAETMQLHMYTMGGKFVNVHLTAWHPQFMTSKMSPWENWFYRWCLQVTSVSSFLWLPWIGTSSASAGKKQDWRPERSPIPRRTLTFDSYSLQIWMNMPLERCNDKSKAKNKLAIKPMTLRDLWQCCRSKLLPTNGVAPS